MNRQTAIVVGETVSITSVNGNIYTGVVDFVGPLTVTGLSPVTNASQLPIVIGLKLTTATAPYAINQTVFFPVTLIAAIG